MQPALHLPLPHKWKRNQWREHWRYHVCDFPFEVCGGFVRRSTRHLDLRAVVFTPFKPSLFDEAESLERGRSSTGTVTLRCPYASAVSMRQAPYSIAVRSGPTPPRQFHVPNPISGRRIPVLACSLKRIAKCSLFPRGCGMEDAKIPRAGRSIGGASHRAF